MKMDRAFMVVYLSFLWLGVSSIFLHFALPSEEPSPVDPPDASVPMGCRVFTADQLIEFALRVHESNITVVIDECWEVQP